MNDNIKYTLTLASLMALTVMMPSFREAFAGSSAHVSSVNDAAVLTAVAANTATSNNQINKLKCPKGHVCTQNPDAIPGVSARTIGNGQLDLTYDANKKEALLKASFVISVDGGRNGVYVYQYPWVGFHDASGQAYYVNSARTMPLDPISRVDQQSDQYGQVIYWIPAKKSAQFKVNATVDPKSLFAGRYYATIDGLLGYPTATSTGVSFININSDKTNYKTIIGETSPYITSITPNQANVGDTVAISGQRLNGMINIDGVAVTQSPIVGNGAGLKFDVPKLSAGWHVVTVGDPGNMSNGVGLYILSNSTTTSCTTFTLNLTVGSTDPEVIILQNFLVKNGFLSNEFANGYFGSQTKAALEAYQTSVGMPATGFFGPETRAKVNAACGATSSTQPFVTVLSPNGGEAYLTGGVMDIKWKTINAPSDAGVRLELHYKIGSPTNDFVQLITEDVVPNTGHYQWVIPAGTDGPGYNSFTVKAILANVIDLASDSSDSYFTVTSPSAPIVSNAAATKGAGISDGTNGSIVAYPVSFNFTVTAGNNPIYISKGESALAFYGGANTIAPTGVSSAPINVMPGDTATTYVVPAGASRNFEFSAIARKSSSTTSAASVQVIAVNYGTSADSVTSSSIVSGLENLKLLLSF